MRLLNWRLGPKNLVEKTKLEWGGGYESVKKNTKSEFKKKIGDDPFLGVAISLLPPNPSQDHNKQGIDRKRDEFGMGPFLS